MQFDDTRSGGAPANRSRNYSLTLLAVPSSSCTGPATLPRLTASVLTPVPQGRQGLPGLSHERSRLERHRLQRSGLSSRSPDRGCGPAVVGAHCTNHNTIGLGFQLMCGVGDPDPTPVMFDAGSGLQGCLCLRREDPRQVRTPRWNEHRLSRHQGLRLGQAGMPMSTGNHYKHGGTQREAHRSPQRGQDPRHWLQHQAASASARRCG